VKGSEERSRGRASGDVRRATWTTRCGLTGFLTGELGQLKESMGPGWWQADVLNKGLQPADHVGPKRPFADGRGFRPRHREVGFGGLDHRLVHVREGPPADCRTANTETQLLTKTWRTLSQVAQADGELALVRLDGDEVCLQVEP
jgi:hypothetical protein